MRRALSSLLLLGAVATAAGPELPLADVTPRLATPNPQRLRVTVTKNGIVVRPLRGTVEQKVTSLKGWVVAATDRDGDRITSLGEALEPRDGRDVLGDQALGSDVEGWAELWIDRAAPFELVRKVMYTVGRRTTLLALGVKTPEGERTVLPGSGGPGEGMLTIAVDGPNLQIVAEGGDKPRDLMDPPPPTQTVKRSLDAVRTAGRAFEKAHAKGRQPWRRSLDKWVCADERGAKLDAARCWRGQVAIFAGGAVPWGDVLPLGAAAQAFVPDVHFPLL